MQYFRSIVGTGDLNLFLYLNNHLHCKVLNSIMPLITRLGGARFTIFISLLLLFISRGEARITAGKGTISLVLSFLLAFFLKKLLSRPRPYLVIPDTNVVDRIWEDYSLPSGHTTASFSFALNYALAYTHLVVPLILVASLIGVSRIYLGHHYPSDVLAGAALGTSTSILIYLI